MICNSCGRRFGRRRHPLLHPLRGRASPQPGRRDPRHVRNVAVWPRTGVSLPAATTCAPGAAINDAGGRAMAADICSAPGRTAGGGPKRGGCDHAGCRRDRRRTRQARHLGQGPRAPTRPGRGWRRTGRNAIQAHEESRWGKLAGYFWGPIPWMIEAAALISLLRRDWPDFAVVTGLLLYNAAVGFWQDNKAANALAALKKGLGAEGARAARRPVALDRRRRAGAGRRGHRQPPARSCRPICC